MDITEILKKLMEASCYRIVMSQPLDKQQHFQKVVFSRVNDRFQIERFTETQAFHEWIDPSALLPAMQDVFSQFRQINAWNQGEEFQIKRSKKNKLFFSRSSAQGAPKQRESVNRQKRYLLDEGKVISPLVDLGIFSSEGKLIASKASKYRQINRFLEFVEDILKTENYRSMRIIDFGCGKSYLTFILYYYLVEVKNIQVDMLGLDLKASVIATCNAIRDKYNYRGLRFEVGDIAGYSTSEPVDLVISLHACDTATDYALFHAIQWKTSHILAIPCCQKEINQQLSADTLGVLSGFGLVKERTASLLTDSIRANLLIALGYKTQVMEFIEIEDTPKNILIRASYGGVTSEQRHHAADQVGSLLSTYHLQQTLNTLCQSHHLLAMSGG